MAPKKILITGAAGMLGKDIAEIFAKDPKYRVFGLVRNEGSDYKKIIYKAIDLRNSPALKSAIKEVDPDIIIHSAAIVDLGACEKDHRDADLVHVATTKILSSYNKSNTRFIYISTDSVFDGKTGNYSETDNTHPLNYYAKSKLKGEKIALTGNELSLIIRTNIYGYHTDQRASLAEWAIANLREKKNINGFTDTIFNPLYTKQLAREIKFLAGKKNVSGIINIGSKKPVNKYDFLKQLAKTFSFDTDLISVARMSDMKMTPARPKNTSLKCEKFVKLTKRKLPTLVAGLNEFKKDYYRSFDKNEDIL